MAAETPGDVENLLRSALRPIEPPEKLSGRRRGDPERGHRGRRRGALRLGGRALRVRAPLPARPSQLGPPRRRDRRRRRRGGRTGPGRAAPPRRQEALALLGAGGPGLGYRRSGPRPGPEPPRLAAYVAAAVRLAGRDAKYAITPVIPRIRCRTLSSLLTGTSLNSTSSLATKVIPPWLGGDEPEYAEGDVEDPDEERRASRGGSGADQQQCPDRDVHDVVPAVDREDAEHVVGPDRVAGREARLVEEADDPGDDQDSAYEQAVEPCGTCVIHRYLLAAMIRFL